MPDDESTVWDENAPVTGYDYFRRMDAFTGTREEIAEKQAKLRASYRASLNKNLPKDFVWHV